MIPANIETATGIEIARHYEAMPVFDRKADAAYLAFEEQIHDQFSRMERVVTVEWSDDDPYASFREMVADHATNNRLRVYRTPRNATAFHPVLSAQSNDYFRAVHDYYGHLIGRGPGTCNRSRPIGFQWEGELEAWRAHLTMFSPLAYDALTTETVGQNSWFNFGPHASIPASQRPYAAQKAGLIPRALWYRLIDDPNQLERLTRGA